eukprot:13336477-Ditylum_brightwellii.AAC.1
MGQVQGGTERHASVDVHWMWASAVRIETMGAGSGSGGSQRVQKKAGRRDVWNGRASPRPQRQ